MPALDSTLRGQLDKQIVKARDIAETAARAALRALAVDQERPFTALSEAQRRQRNALRAKARQLGSGSQIEGWEPLVEEVAYEQWHRMLFARFLAENHLLMHPTGCPVTLAECAELAAEEGEPDAWVLAARYAERDAAGHLPRRRPVRAGALRPRGPRRARGDPAEPAARRLHRRRLRSAGSTSSGRPSRRTRSTIAAARSAAPTWRR